MVLTNMEVSAIPAREKCMSKAPGGGESRATLGKWLIFQGSELREGDMASPCLDKEWALQRGIRLWALRRGLYLQHDSGWYAMLVRILLHIHYSSFSLGPSLRKRELWRASPQQCNAPAHNMVRFGTSTGHMVPPRHQGTGWHHPSSCLGGRNPEMHGGRHV